MKKYSLVLGEILEPANWLAFDPLPLPLMSSARTLTIPWADSDTSRTEERVRQLGTLSRMVE